MDDSMIYPKIMTGLDDLITSPPNAPYFDILSFPISNSC